MVASENINCQFSFMNEMRRLIDSGIPLATTLISRYNLMHVVYNDIIKWENSAIEHLKDTIKLYEMTERLKLYCSRAKIPESSNDMFDFVDFNNLMTAWSAILTETPPKKHLEHIKDVFNTLGAINMTDDEMESFQDFLYGKIDDGCSYDEILLAIKGKINNKSVVKDRNDRYGRIDKYVRLWYLNAIDNDYALGLIPSDLLR